MDALRDDGTNKRSDVCIVCVCTCVRRRAMDGQMDRWIDWTGHTRRGGERNMQSEIKEVTDGCLSGEGVATCVHALIGEGGEGRHA
mmetsp:Transcript_48800/g.122218  ORF Transcript_48800/g.122218 Transcript_48800/m.122218 type:complete len:86 (+) Transcript_48800:815-1072(+)